MEEGITELPDKLKIVKEDTNAYLESTKKQADHLLGKNYEEFKTVFQNTINSKYNIFLLKKYIRYWNNRITIDLFFQIKSNFLNTMLSNL